MKIKTFGLVALLGIGALTLAGCNKDTTPVENPEEEVEVANPASVYCEENGWYLLPQLDEAGNTITLCVFENGIACEEWDLYNGICQMWEVVDETTEATETETAWNTSEIYSDEDILAAQDVIMNTINNEWEVKVEWVELVYAWDEAATSNLEYCQSLNPEITECAVFTSSFHIPEQDAQMAWAFEPNTDMNGYSWYLGRIAGGEWTVLTNGLG